jgi:hypothetical protein
VTDQNIAIMKACLAGVSKLLLGQSVLKPGVGIIAGKPLDQLKKTELSEMAFLSKTDVIHLEFATNDAGRFGLVGICVFVPRDQVCYAFSDCQLWLGHGKSKAVILPRPGARGHFRMGPGELIHVDGKPCGGLDEGIARAHARLCKIVERAPCVKRQVRIEEIPVYR